MKNWFCESNGLSGVVKALVYAAGVAVGQNNKPFVEKASPVASSILAAVDKGVDSTAVNAMLKEAITALVDKASDNPAIKGAVALALTDLQIDIPAGTFPTFEADAVVDMVQSFNAGLLAGAAVAK